MAQESRLIGDAGPARLYLLRQWRCGEGCGVVPSGSPRFSDLTCHLQGTRVSARRHFRVTFGLSLLGSPPSPQPLSPAHESRADSSNFHFSTSALICSTQRRACRTSFPASRYSFHRSVATVAVR